VPVDSSALARDIEAIEKKYGKGSIVKGNPELEIPRIPTGSLELDYITGGGIPIGRYSRFYGGYMSAKTLTCWNVIREAQKMGLTCAYYDIEKQFDPAFVARLGVNVDDLYVVEGSIMEEVGAKLETLLGSIHLHVLDSCSMAVSTDELNMKMEDWGRALSARVWGKIFRKVHDKFDKNENVVILVDQVRVNLNANGAEEPPGGKMLNFQSSLNLQFKRSSWLYRKEDGTLSDKGTKEGLSGDKEPDGVEILVRTVKSRIGRAFRPARLRLDLDTGKFDQDFELVKSAVYFNVVEQKGSWFVLPNGESVQGANGLRQAILQDTELREQVVHTVMENA
jgi:recombination protein RecA